MKEVTIVAYCDGNHENREPSSVERTVTIDGSKPVILDLCGECDKAILALLALMEQGAVLPQAKKPAAKKASPTEASVTALSNESLSCPECEYTGPNRAALGQHTRGSHGKGLKEYKKAS